MARIDELKEDLSYLKFWLGIDVAVILGILGWGFTNYEKISSFLICLSLIALVFLLIVLYLLNRFIRQKIKEIGKI